MECVFIKNSPTLGELNIKISPEDYLPVFEKELKKIANKAQIKGFRPGKTPISVIKNMYGKAILADEINKLLNTAVDSYIADNNIAYLGDLMPLNDDEEIDFNLNAKNTYNFKLQVATAAPFDLNLNAIVVKSYQPTISEEEIEDIMQKNAERFAKEEEVEAVENNSCTIIGKAVWQEESQDGAEPILQEQECYLPIETFLAEKQNAIIGAKIGDVITVVPSQDLDLDENDKKIGYVFGIFDNEQAQKLKDKNIQITINTIVKKQAREYNKEFFEELFPEQNVETLEQFREKIISLEEDNMAREFSYFNESLLKDAILEAHQFELPDEFLKDWLLRTNQKLSKEQIEKEYPYASKDIRWSVIQRIIVQENDIKVEQSEINNYATNFILNQFRQYGLLNNPETANAIPNIVKNYLSADKGKNMMQIYDTILRTKVMDLAKSKTQLENLRLHWKEVDAIGTAYFNRQKEELTNNKEASATEN